MKTNEPLVIETVECPYCNHDDQTAPLAIIGNMMEWICNRCGLTWNRPLESDL